MSTLKVDTIEHETATSAIDLPNKFKVGGAGVEQVYTSSASQPSDGEAGDFWWDSANEKIYRYIGGEFKELTEATTSSSPNWGGSRGLSVGGKVSSRIASIDYFDLSVTSNNAQDFGDLTVATEKASCVSSGSRGVKAGGQIDGSGFVYTNSMEYWTFATPGNAQDFGDLLSVLGSTAAASNSTRGLIAMGQDQYTQNASTGRTNTIQYITIATTGNTTDFGDLSDIKFKGMGTNDLTRAVFAGGFDHDGSAFSYTNVMDYVTMATTGNATDFGDLLDGTVGGGIGTVSDNTTGVFSGGNKTNDAYNNNIEKITIATTGNATDFGDMLTSLAYHGQTSNPDNARGVIMGGFYNPGTVTTNTIQYITISSPGNATDFGDLTGNIQYGAGSSGSAS